MTVVTYVEGEMPHTKNRWPTLLRAMDDVVQRVRTKVGPPTIEDVVRDYPDHTPVYVVVDRAAQGAPYLDDFEHPEKALYIFGPDHGEMVPPPDAVRVTIFMSPSRRSLFSDQAGAMVLYHRRLQRGDWT
jgi:hypothetical protein